MKLHTIAGKLVTDEVYDRIRELKSRGSLVSLVYPEAQAPHAGWSSEFEVVACENCNGGGSIGYEYMTGGPFSACPATESHGRYEGDKEVDPPARATFRNGKWFLQKTRMFKCAVCGGTGERLPVARPQPIKELIL